MKNQTIEKEVFSKRLGMVRYTIDLEDYETIFKTLNYTPVANKMGNNIYIRVYIDGQYDYLSRSIMNAKDNQVVTYKDKNPLNLSKSNLILKDKKKHVKPFLKNTKVDEINLKNFNQSQPQSA